MSLCTRVLRPLLTTAVGLFWLDAGAQTALQLKPDASTSIGALAAKALIVALICLGAVAAGLYLWRNRWQGRVRSSTAATLVDMPRIEWARRISPRSTLVLVQWDGRRYLLAESANAVHVIDQRANETSSHA